MTHKIRRRNMARAFYVSMGRNPNHPYHRTLDAFITDGSIKSPSEMETVLRYLEYVPKVKYHLTISDYSGKVIHTQDNLTMRMMTAPYGPVSASG